MNKLFNKLKKRWGVGSLWEVLLILFIFSITGMTALYIRKFAFGMMGITPQTPGYLRFLGWIFTVFPAYQGLFLFYGFIFGQFEFVWNFEKKSMGRFKTLFVKLKPNKTDVK